MDITALASSQAIAPEGPATGVAEAATGFAEVLGSVQSGAPPGPEPPPAGVKVGEEVAIPGLIAQSLNPDFLLQATADATGTPVSDPQDQKGATDKKDTTQGGAESVLMLSAMLGATAFSPPILNQPVHTVPGSPDLKGASPSTGKVETFLTVQVPATALVQLDDAPQNATQTFEVPPAPPVVATQSDAATKVEARPTIQPRLSTEAQASVQTSTAAQASVQTPTVTQPQAQAPASDVAQSPVVVPNPDSPKVQGNQIAAAPVADPKIAPQTQTQPTPVAKLQDPVAVAQVTSALPADVKATVTVAQTSGVAAEASPVPVTKADQKPVVGAPVSAKKEASKTAVNAVVATEVVTVEEVEKVEAKAPAVETKTFDSSTANVLRTESQPKAAEVASPVTKQGLDPKDLNMVVKQITDRMELLAATRPKNGITIQLQPAHLGSITLTVKSLGGAIEAHIASSNDDVRAALEQNRQLLGQAIESRGLKLDSVSFAPQAQDWSSHQRSTSQQQQQQQEHQQQQQAQAYRANSSGSTAYAPLSAHQARQTVRSFDGVDLWI